MVKNILAGAAALVVFALPPVAMAGECYDGCMINCVWNGTSVIVCKGICADVVCFAATYSVTAEDMQKLA